LKELLSENLIVVHLELFLLGWPDELGIEMLKQGVYSRLRIFQVHLVMNEVLIVRLALGGQSIKVKASL